MPPRLFTLEEAVALLPKLVPIVEEIQARKRELDEWSARLEGVIERASGNGHALTAEQVEARERTQAAGREIERLMGEIDALGVELKGIDEGLVDFRSMREGRVVYLCWRLGEETIGYWHELETGFSGRQPL